MTSSSTPPSQRFRTTAYVFFEDPGAASWSARLAGAEVPMALLWAGSLLGFLFTVLVAPSVSAVAAAVIIAAEVIVFVSALALSAAWLRGHRTPVLARESLVLEGAIDSRHVAYGLILRAELSPLPATTPPLSRVSIVSSDGAHVHLDMPRDEALAFCRALQRRIFGGAVSPPHDPALRTLDRERDPVATWVSRLRERFAKSGYRHAAGIADDELDRALHDAGLPSGRRVGAALAMCAAGGADGRDRVLRIAERLETKALRIAVMRAAEGTLDDDALAAAEAEDSVVGRPPAQIES